MDFASTSAGFVSLILQEAVSIWYQHVYLSPAALDSGKLRNATSVPVRQEIRKLMLSMALILKTQILFCQIVRQQVFIFSGCTPDSFCRSTCLIALNYYIFLFHRSELLTCVEKIWSFLFSYIEYKVIDISVLSSSVGVIFILLNQTIKTKHYIEDD